MGPAAWAVLLAVVSMLMLAARTVAARGCEADRTLSPYFLVASDDRDVDRLPLVSTTAEVRIAGVIADVTVTQVYRNDGSRALEAIYVFPASTRAAVHGMRMTVGSRTIEARIAEREQARQSYEQARDTGLTASLLEQQRPNVFQMNVANILAGDEVRVELRYSELLVPEDGLYSFVYPTVAGPRYANVPEDGAAADQQWVANPYLHEGEPPPYRFDIAVTISGGMPIRKIACSSHRTAVTFDGPALARVRLDPGEKAGGNRDFVLSWALAGSAVESGLLLYRGQQESFFLAMVQPPERVAVEAIPNREYIFVVDVSGSMHGFPLDVAKDLLGDLIRGLRPTDFFNVLLFAGGSSLLAEHSLAASTDNLRRAIELIERQRGGGGTELLPALRRALSLPRDGGVSRSLVVVTDGYVEADREALTLIRQNLGRANLFAFGIGSSVNRYLIEGMARAGMGEPFVVTSQDEAAPAAGRFRRYIKAPVLTSVHIEAEGFETYDMEPPAIPDVLAARPVVVFGKWRGAPRGRLVVRGKMPGGEYRRVLEARDATSGEENAALRQLWARHRIASLADADSLGGDGEIAGEITRLGLAHGLLTRYTSFVAVDTVRRGDGTLATVKQPLPLPLGVSDMAVGAKKGAGLAPAAMMRSSVAHSAMGAVLAAPGLEPRQAPAVSREQVTADEDEPAPACAACLEMSLGAWRFRGLAAGSIVVIRLQRDPAGWRLVAVELDGAPASAAVELVVGSRVATLATCLEAASPRGDAATLRARVGPGGRISLLDVSPVTGRVDGRE